MDVARHANILGVVRLPREQGRAAKDGLQVFRQLKIKRPSSLTANRSRGDPMFCFLFCICWGW